MIGWHQSCITEKERDNDPCLVLSAARSSRLNQEAFCLIEASAWKITDDWSNHFEEMGNHLKYHCNARGVSNVFELLDIRPDVVALVLVLGRHHQCEGRVNVRHGECSGLLVDFWDTSLNNVGIDGKRTQCLQTGETCQRQRQPWCCQAGRRTAVGFRFLLQSAPQLW